MSFKENALRTRNSNLMKKFTEQKFQQRTEETLLLESTKGLMEQMKIHMSELSSKNEKLMEDKEKLLTDKEMLLNDKQRFLEGYEKEIEKISNEIRANVRSDYEKDFDRLKKNIEDLETENIALRSTTDRLTRWTEDIIPLHYRHVLLVKVRQKAFDSLTPPMISDLTLLDLVDKIHSNIHPPEFRPSKDAIILFCHPNDIWNYAEHHVDQGQIAHAVLALPDGDLRIQFIELFWYLFGENPVL